MASLLEVANVARKVTVRGMEVNVYGVSGEGLAGLMVRFPEVGKLFSGVDFDQSKMMELAPKALAALIAAGTGNPGDDAAEKVAATLAVAEQLDLIDEIMRLTFPRGIGPFVEKLQGLGLLVQVGEVAGAEAASATPSPSSQKS